MQFLRPSFMPSVADALLGWSRKPASLIANWRHRVARPETFEQAGESMIYRLRYWPQIPSGSKTADIYRTLSVMSNRPVNRRWILNNSSLSGSAVDTLLRRLIEQNAVEVIDARQYRPESNAA